MIGAVAQAMRPVRREDFDELPVEKLVNCDLNILPPLLGSWLKMDQKETTPVMFLMGQAGLTLYSMRTGRRPSIRSV